jgi:phosphopantetheinyl transferase
MAGREMMLRLDLDQDPWPRIFGLNGQFSIVLLELNGLDAATVAEYLTPPEMEHFGRFTHLKRKKEWLGGRIAAKQAAMAMTSSKDDHGAPPWLSVEVATEPDGRPFILAVDGPEQMLPDISISHSRGMAAAMATEEGRCGIDIQKVTPAVIRVRERFAGVAELRILEDLIADWSEATRLSLLWAAKEALKKAIGTRRLPGYLGISLSGTNRDNHAPIGDYFVFDFTLPKGVITQSQKDTVAVAVLSHKEYGLAFTGVSKQYIKQLAL